MKRIMFGMAVCLAAGMAMCTVCAKEGDTWFPFVISYGGEDNASSVAHLLDAPAGKYGFVRVKDGEFVTDKGSIRFNGTNLTGPANFPEHATADRLAARLARLGINCARLHFMDTWYKNFMDERKQGILADDTETQRKLSPEQLDKLDYLIAALKKAGVYVNMNLHVGRTLDERDGVPAGSPWANKTVGQFTPRIVELQKEYARDLLTHVNRYTGNAYINEPAVAMIEISNEDQGLVQCAKRGGIQSLAQPFRLELERQWNEWLHAKYASAEAIRASWMRDSDTLGAELLPDGSLTGWRLVQEDARASCSVKDGIIRVDVAKEGAQFNPKILRKLSLKAGKLYTIAFRVHRVSGTGRVSCAVADPERKWKVLWNSVPEVSPKWETFTATFEADETTDTAVLQFSQMRNGSYEFDAISLREGMPKFKQDPSAKFAQKSIPLLHRHTVVSRQMRSDYNDFLWQSELGYWKGMRDYVRDTLKAHAPVSGTQSGHYSPRDIQRQLDYVDSHAYFHHPHGKGAPWVNKGVTNDWSAGGESLVHGMSTLLSLDRNAHATEKPFTVSEYSHPYPSPFVGEGQPLACAFGQQKGWDGIFQYSYNHFPDDYEPQGMPWCIFDGLANPAVLAHMPVCAAMMVRGDVRADPTEKSGELIWNRDRRGKEYVTVNTRNSKLFAGYADGRQITLGDISLNVGATETGCATISLVSRNATGFGTAGKASVLIAASGAVGNTGAKVERISKTAVRLLDRGHAPVLAEGIPCEITFPVPPARLTCYALAPDGSRRQQVKPAATDDGARAILQLTPANRTLWYEVEIR
ncbi:MAG: carbohydrate binding domain-containing protein [Kiritimatiellae bacterium]|nr:carbohydrate binding domain-containing protein [Kiritimatiellia bacterium]